MMTSHERGNRRKRVVVVGGGFGGAYAAQELSRKLPRDWDLVVVDRNNFLLFYPLLVEAGVGSLEARHVVVPIRKFLKRGELRMGEVQGIDLTERQVTLWVHGANRPEQLDYDHLVLAPGSVTRFPNVPGVREHAFQLKSLSDGLELRDHGIRLLELANTSEDAALRRAVLRVVVVGANFTGVEFAGEYQDFLRDAARAFNHVKSEEIEVVLVEYGPRILPALDEELASYAHRHLAQRGLRVLTKTSVTEIGEHFALLTTGERLDCYTTVWCAGIAPPPLLDSIPGLPRTPQGYIDCDADLRVKGFSELWAVGDVAGILDPEGKPYPATAQHATREGVQCARNLLRSIEGKPTVPFKFRTIGSLAALGCRTAVVRLFGLKLSGFLAWFLYRTVYLFKMPSWARRFRIIMDWTTDLFFRRDPVQLGVRSSDRSRDRSERSKDEPQTGLLR